MAASYILRGNSTMRSRTLADVLVARAQTSPNAPYLRCIERGRVVSTHTFGEIWRLASRWAALLRDRAVGRGDVVVLALPNSEDFVGAFLGVQLIGATPAPVAPTRRAALDEHYLVGLENRLRLVESRVLVAPRDRSDLAAALALRIERLDVVSGRDLPEGAAELGPTALDADLGLLQFTSGTSGISKVVRLSHASLIAQTRGIASVLRIVEEEDSGLSWLPAFHDMGLIGFLLTPLYVGTPINLMQTEEFMRSPKSWMRTVSEVQATITGGPPSSYVLCARHTRDVDLEELDLACVRCALAGAEVITAESLRRFAERFRPSGFREASFIPTYGMAENTLAVTMTPPSHGPLLDYVDSAELQSGHAAAVPEGDRNDGSARVVVSVGGPLAETEIAIVDERGQQLCERRVGEIVVRSPSLMEGYHRRPGETRQALRKGWLWTGDLGYRSNGALFVTGRKKEILIVGGRNYYPGELEEVAARVPGVRAGRAVAFSVLDGEQATEKVIVLVETTHTENAERDALRRCVRAALVEAGYPVAEVGLVQGKTIETTATGKVRRLECRARYLAGEFAEEPGREVARKVAEAKVSTDVR